MLAFPKQLFNEEFVDTKSLMRLEKQSRRSLKKVNRNAGDELKRSYTDYNLTKYDELSSYRQSDSQHGSIAIDARYEYNDPQH